MADYPSLLIDWQGFQELPRQYQTIRTEYEAGYVQTRAKTTTGPRGFRFMHRLVSAADVATFYAFWDARKGGAEAFTFTDPRTGSVLACRFVGERPGSTRRGPANVAFDLGPITLEEAL